MKINLKLLFPALFSFFVMGFVDIVGISVSYVKEDFTLSDTLAGLLPMMVFLWFAVFSLPTETLMRKDGRKNTVMLSAAITVVGMVLPLISYSLPSVLAAFVLLGIGNTLLQVSMNPLMADIVPMDKLTGKIILGQFVKALSSTIGPLIVGLAATVTGSWKVIFVVYALFALVSLVWMYCVKIDETAPTSERGGITGLFKDKYLMLLFSGIVLIVGFETGLVSAMPQYLSEKFSMSLEKGGMACSVYFCAKMLGTLSGSFIVSNFSRKKFLGIITAMAILSFTGLFVSPEPSMVFVSLFIVGLMTANVFGILLGEGLRYRPEQTNEVSALMVTGIAGGALIPPVMGALADVSSYAVSLIVPVLILSYILIISFRLKCE